MCTVATCQLNPEPSDHTVRGTGKGHTLHTKLDASPSFFFRCAEDSEEVKGGHKLVFRGLILCHQLVMLFKCIFSSILSLRDTLCLPFSKLRR